MIPRITHRLWRLLVVAAAALPSWSCSPPPRQSQPDDATRFRQMLECCEHQADSQQMKLMAQQLSDELDRCRPTRETARIYSELGNSIQYNGDLVQAHDILLRAVELCRRSDEPCYDIETDCYYSLATDYLNAGDVDRMREIMGRMRRSSILSGSDHSKHDYHAVTSAYYTLLVDRETDPDRRICLRDSMISHAVSAAQYTDRFIADGDKGILNPVWDYYNLAIMYDLHFDPPRRDSIRYWLDRADQAKSVLSDPTIIAESDISIGDMRAWLLMYEGRYDEAERKMQQVIAILDTMERVHANTLIAERSEAYDFLFELSRRRGDAEKTFDYGRQLIDYNKHRYDIERAAVLNDLQERYDTRQRQQRIEELKRESRLHRQLNTVLIVLAAILLTAVVLLRYLFRLRRANIEQRMYETALTAEMSARELAQIKQRLSDSVSRTTIENVRALVDSSRIDAARRKEYIERIERIDAAGVDDICASAVAAITSMDRKYMICFMAGIATADIASLFNIEPETVYIVRHRLKKKFQKGVNLPF